MADKAIQEKLAGACIRSVVHLRQQLHARRLAIFFGAGASRDLGFPKWPDLITKVTDALTGRGIVAPEQEYPSITYKTQILYQKFFNKRVDEADVQALPAEQRIMQIRYEWRKLIHEQLYEDPKTTDENELDNHPYLRELLPAIQLASMNVNYNFDDSLEPIPEVRSQEQ